MIAGDGKPTMALMGEIGTRLYVGSAFVTFGRPASDRFWALVEANPGAPPPGIPRKSKDPVQWLNPGIVGCVRPSARREEAEVRTADERLGGVNILLRDAACDGIAYTQREWPPCLRRWRALQQRQQLGAQTPCERNLPFWKTWCVERFGSSARNVAKR